MEKKESPTVRTRRILPAFILAGLALTAVTAESAAEPLTLYKRGNIETARENIRRYPWAQKIVEGWKKNVSLAMTRDRAFFEEMIPPLTMWPLYGQSCPVCVGERSAMGETGLYRWSIDDPERIVCRYCGTVYPNPSYPETGGITCPRMGQTFTFYLTDEERAHPDDTSGKYAFRWASWPVHTSFSGIIRYRKAAWCIGKIPTLAKLYAITGDVRYAEKAAMIMDVVADRYPNWLFHSYNGTYADCPPGEAARELGRNPRGGRFPVETIVTAFDGLHTKGDYAELNNGFWGAGRFGCSGSDGGFILNMTVAYDLIRDACYDDGRPVVTPEMENRIVNDLIIAGCEDSENWAEINNKCGPGRAMSGAVGILFNRPESVRRAIEGFEKLMEKSFHFDGFCRESPSYSAMHLNLLRNIPEILAGYSDPPGYRPGAGDPLKNYDPFVESDRYRLALVSMVRMLDPANLFPVIGDTHYNTGIDPIYAEVLTAHYGESYAGLLEQAQGAPLSEKGGEYALWNRPPDLRADRADGLPRRSEWFPGWRVSVMRGGPVSGETALYFNGYAYHGHRHYDTLGISYFACGRELASDRGYIWDDPRNAWTKSTLSHNIVTVDDKTQDRGGNGSTLELFGAGPFVEVTRASADVYSMCDTYERTTALIVAPDASTTYAVDFFRVSGGTLHRYGLNCNGALVSLAGVEQTALDRTEKWLDKLRGGVPPGPVTATWRYGGVSFETTVLSPADRIVVADAPGWRTYRGDELDAPPIQQLFAEREGESGMISLFAAVMAPYAGSASPVGEIRLLHHDVTSGSAAVAVEFDGRTDYIISTQDEAARSYGPVLMAGRFGYASVDGEGVLMRAYLLAGTELTCGGRGIQLDRARATLPVSSVEGRTYRLSEELPGPGGLAGKYLLAGKTGFEIESADGRSVTVRDYPAVESDTVTILNSAVYER